MERDAVPIVPVSKLGIAAGVLAAGLIFGAPSQTFAKDEFERGFKDELGRIGAHEAVFVGKSILAGVLLGPGYGGGYGQGGYGRGGYGQGGYGHGGYGRPMGYGYGYGHGYGHRHPHFVKQVVVVHHVHHAGCGHAYHQRDGGAYYAPAPYRYERYERYDGYQDPPQYEYWEASDDGD